MQTTHTPVGLYWPIADQPVNARLRWLLDANACERARLARAPVEEQVMKMRRPVSIKRAYALFGLLLGTLPPAAIFYRMFGGIMSRGNDAGWFLLLIVAMNVACALAGRFVASRLSSIAETVESDSRLRMLLLTPFVGMLWGACAGGLGGLVFFLFGAVFGSLAAMPVGILAFALFMPLHRSVARGGMIEASHLWPLACGVTMAITALILGL
jgi:hypothetical protein